MFREISQNAWKSIGFGAVAGVLFATLIMFSCDVNRIGSLQEQVITDDGEISLQCATYANIPFLCLLTVNVKTQEAVEVRVPVEDVIQPVIDGTIEKEIEPEVKQGIVERVAEELEGEPSITVEDFVEISIQVIDEIYYGEDDLVKNDPVVVEPVVETPPVAVVDPVVETPPMETIVPISEIIEDVEEIIEDAVENPTPDTTPPVVIEPREDVVEADDPVVVEPDEDEDIVVSPPSNKSALQAHLDVFYHVDHFSTGLHSHERITHSHDGLPSHLHFPHVHRHITPREEVDEPKEITKGYVVIIEVKLNGIHGSIILSDFIVVVDRDDKTYVQYTGLDGVFDQGDTEKEAVEVLGLSSDWTFAEAKEQLIETMDKYDEE